MNRCDRVLFFIILGLSFPSFAQEEHSDRSRLKADIAQNFPLEMIWAQVALTMDLEKGKILHIREFIQPYWSHRNQILENSTDGDREKLQERLKILRDRFIKELPKHLTEDQINHISVLRGPRPESRDSKRSLEWRADRQKTRPQSGWIVLSHRQHND